MQNTLINLQMIKYQFDIGNSNVIQMDIHLRLKDKTVSQSQCQSKCRIRTHRTGHEIVRTGHKEERDT